MKIVIKRSNKLTHYGVKRRSGRFPFGSGVDPMQHSRTFLSEISRLESQGMSRTEIAKAMGMTTTQFRNKVTLANDEIKKQNISAVLKLKEKGYSNITISEKLGLAPNTVKNYLNVKAQLKADVINNVTNQLKDELTKSDFVDIGYGIPKIMGVSKEKLRAAVENLTNEGNYHVLDFKIVQQSTGMLTTMKVLAPVDKTVYDAKINKDKIAIPDGRSDDLGHTFKKIEPPVSIDSKRLEVRYGPDGGGDRDGVIELRRGVDDLSLGRARYAQVRIAVDDSHYLKGMAVYADDLPPGIDIRFNTNKKNTGNKLDALKELKDDPANPFKASIKETDKMILCQKTYIDKNGKERQSPINIVNEEGDWSKWSKSLSSQFLAKQNPELAKEKLTEDYDKRKRVYDEIVSYTNPSVKQKMLQEFADECDAAAVHLKGAAMPRQSTNVILPVPSLKPNEIYAPNYRDGERLALVRFPHAGVFEIPEVIVNNKNVDAKKMIGNSRDAVGIHPETAQILSGADFDGDSVLTIPNNNKRITTRNLNDRVFASLKDFDPKMYKLPPGTPKISDRQKGALMGSVSNLITDMTIRNASPAEIVKAVKHSMVVIDAQKHDLDYKQSYIDNDIATLKARYQGGKNKGASTLLSKASAEISVPHYRKGKKVVDTESGKEKRYMFDPETGEKYRETSGETYTEFRQKVRVPGTNRHIWEKIDYKTYRSLYSENPDNPNLRTLKKERLLKTSQMALTDDAYSLSSGTRIESIYANYANSLKALANDARKELFSVEIPPINISAKKVYSAERESLLAKLNEAEKNSPYERKANMVAASKVYLVKQDNPDMSKEELKKLKDRSLKTAREMVGAKKKLIDISDNEWAAIQANALSKEDVRKILNNTDMEKIKQRALPRISNVEKLTESTIYRAKMMAESGKSRADISDALGISLNQLSYIIDQK